MSSTGTDSKRKILTAARTLLESGEGRSRMADFARAAGMSRQAVYLHFASRAELLVALTRHIDAQTQVDARLRPSREAPDGRARLAAYVAFCAGQWPLVEGLARALIAMRATDAEADAAWRGRMDATAEGCRAAIDMLAHEGRLAPGWSAEAAAQMLAAMLSFEAWVQLVPEGGWTEEDYRARMGLAAERAFVA